MAQDVLNVSGLDKLMAGLRHAPELVRQRSAKAVAASTLATEQRVRSLAPEDTGALKRAISSKSSDLVGTVLIAPSAHYWRFVEYGTSRMAANPFVRTAAEVETGPFVDRMAQVVVERDLGFL